MPDFTIKLGDTVHARIYNEDRSSVAIQEFVVTEIDGNTYKGGAIECNAAAGWELERLRPTAENLGLPANLSEITAYSHDRRPFNLMGKGETWVTDAGESYPISQILAWDEGHI